VEKQACKEKCTGCSIMIYSGANYSIELDLSAELNKWAYDNLIQRGFCNVSLDNAFLQYCNMDLRLLTPKPRKIYVSRELVCPDSCREGYDFFMQAVKNGADLLPFMSRSICDVTSSDKMIFDWGLFHFHLATEKYVADPRFMDRSDYLLIAYVGRDNDDVMYFLQIRPHIPSVWTEQEMIRILADNWPDTMEKHRIPGYASLTENVTDEEYEQLRKNNINSFVDLHDGRVYHGANGGLNSAGTSVRAVMKHNYFLNNAKQCELAIGEMVDDLGATINKKLEEKAFSFKLNLIKPGYSDYLFEVDGYGILLQITILDGGKMRIVASDRTIT